MSGGTPQQETFENAIRFFEAGQLENAASVCRRLLDINPHDLSAMNMLGVIAASAGNFAEAAERFEACAAAAPDDPGVIKNLAQAYLETGRHAEAVDRFEQLGRVTGKPFSNLRIVEIRDFNPACRTDTKFPYISHLKEVTVDSSYWGMRHNDGISFSETASLNPSNSPYIKGRIDKNHNWAAVDMPEPTLTIETTCVFLGGDENYAHWILRYLMRLAGLEQRRELSDLPLLTIDTLLPYQRDSLELLGYKTDRLVALPRHTVAKLTDVHVPVCLRTGETEMKFGLDWLRQKFLSPEVMTEVDGPTRIFVSRRDAPSRYLENEQEIVERLSAFDVRSVELSRLSFAEQISLFSQAELVVGPHGAGMVNLSFAPEGCGFIELISDPIAHMNEIRMIADLLQMPTKVIPSNSVKIDEGATQPMVQHRFTTNADAVVRAVEDILS